MKVTLQNSNNERSAAAAFTKQSVVFDALYRSNAIVQYKRERVRSVVMEFVRPGKQILEINCGTGEDAIFFAQNGYTVHATDISQGMLDQLHYKVQQYKLGDKISLEQCSYTALDKLEQDHSYDAVFSNFGGLNCTGELDKVLLSFNKVLKPGGIACLVILPAFCLQETLLALRGKFKTAFRRFFSNKGRTAHIEGEHFTCWYYDPSFVKKVLQNNFTVLATEGLCTLVPPSYIEQFAEKHPRIFSFLSCRKQVEKNMAMEFNW